MYERCLNEAERILATHRDVIVPVRQVWREVVEESKKQQFEVPDFADFTAMLEGDLRFDFLPEGMSLMSRRRWRVSDSSRMIVCA